MKTSLEQLPKGLPPEKLAELEVVEIIKHRRKNAVSSEPKRTL